MRRLTGLLPSSAAEVAIGGDTARDDRFIAPSVLTSVAPDDPVVDDEIIGPILPVIAVHDVADAIGFVCQRPKPLALHVFSGTKPRIDGVLADTTSGSVGVSCTVLQVANPAPCTKAREWIL